MLHASQVAALNARFPSSLNRMGTIVFNDRVPISVHVDWTWVKQAVPAIITIPGILNVVSAVVGADVTRPFTFGPFPQLLSAPPALLNAIFGANGTANTNTTQQATQLLKRLGLYNNATRAALKGVFKGASGAANRKVLVSVSASADGLSIKPNGDIALRNVVLHQKNVAFKVGDVLISLAQALSLLPNSPAMYPVQYPATATVMFNASSPHGIAAFRGEVVAAAFQRCYDALPVPNRALYPNVTYVAKNHPLPLTANQTLEIRVVLALLASLFILVPLCYIPGSFVTFLVRERTSKAKHLQLVSSVSPYLYWAAVYIWDASLFTFLVFLIICALFGYRDSAAQIFISDAEGGAAVFLLLFFYGLSVLPLCYLYSMLFENHSTAQISIMAINFATGFVAVLAYFVMSGIEITRPAALVLVQIFRLFPPYLIGEGLINVSTTAFVNNVLHADQSYFNWFVAGRGLTFMGAEMIGYFLIVLLTEAPIARDFQNYVQKRRALIALQRLAALKQAAAMAAGGGGAAAGAVGASADEVDEDVVREAAVVAAAGSKADFALCIDSLVKVRIYLPCS